MQKLRVKVINLRIEKEKTQGQISENSGSKLQNSGFGISPNLVKFSRTAQKTRRTTSSTRLPQRTMCVLIKELSLGCFSYASWGSLLLTGPIIT